MFRKIHSNRDPGGTLGSEFKKEFAVYFETAGRFVRSVLERNPKGTLIGMAVCILISLVLSFTLFRKPPKTAMQAGGTSPTVRRPAKMPVSDGLDQILATTSALQQTLIIKKRVEELLARPALTAADSTELERALDQLSQLQNHLNQKP
jgi:hypothetical protein